MSGSEKYFDQVNFEKEDFTIDPIATGEYDQCIFSACNFANVDLTGIRFIECSFKGCNFSMTIMKQTSLQTVVFEDCKLIGIHFDDCNKFLFTVVFKTCVINHSSFSNISMKQTVFRNCNLKESDFSGSDLSSSVFDQCDLHSAIFENSNLEKADFSTAFNFSIDPVKNKIRKAKFSMHGLPGLLEKYDLRIVQ